MSLCLGVRQDQVARSPQFLYHDEFLDFVSKQNKNAIKSRQNFTKTAGAGPGLGSASWGQGWVQDFENEFAGAGEKMQIPAVPRAGILVEP